MDGSDRVPSGSGSVSEATESGDQPKQGGQGERGSGEPQGDKPKRRGLKITLAVVFGMLIGSSVMVANYAEGLAYLSNDPQACTKCHVMQPQYDGWLRSPHHAVATCNDCHTPHDIVGKYMAKARNGWNHSTAFTFQNFDEPIRIKPANAEILNHNCVSCHEDFVNNILGHPDDQDEELLCVNCHRSVGHGPTR